MPWRRRSATRGSRWRRPRPGAMPAVVARFDPDLIVLDWMLPDVEGIEVGRRLRERGHKNAILFLTAKDVEHKVEALRAGGDDYVTKPFSLAEVVARVHATLRRTAGDLPGTCCATATSCWTRAAMRSSAARRSSSSPRPSSRCSALPAQPAPRARRDRSSRTWRYDFRGNSNVVETYVSYLRRKLDAAARR